MSIFAKKSLGQNFLNSDDVLEIIVETAQIGPNDTILEVGPGHGVLTKLLLDKAKAVFAIEKDENLVSELKKTFDQELENKKLTLISGDILENTPQTLGIGTETPYKIVANIPYYITGQFLRNTLENKHAPEKMVLLLQKEVAERICALDGAESLLSISVKVFGKPEYIATVPAENFDPRPNVDSAILQISEISRKIFSSNEEESHFFDILHKGFVHKRKILASNLKISAETLEKSGIPTKSRAENLSVSDWIKLSKII